MKHIISLLTLFLCCTSLHAQDRVVEQPAFEVRNTNTLEFQKIILNDTATIMYVDAYYRPKYWIKIVDETTLEANGKSYRIKAGDGIKLNEEFWMPESGTASFRLIFLPPPVEARPGRVSEKQMRRVRPQSMYRQNGGRGLSGRSSL